MGKRALSLTIIICTNNRYDLLEKALASALAQEDAADDIIVVDNSPNKAEGKAFAQRFSDSPKVRFAFEEIQSLSHARNVGTSLAQTDIVAFIDDDAIAEPGWAKALRETFDTVGSDAGCVGGIVKPIWPSAPPAWVTPTLAAYLSIVDWGDRQKELSPTEWLAGCNIAFRRQALLAIGGFRTDIGRTGNPVSLLSNEETSACRTLEQAGYRIFYSPQAVVSHHIDKKRLNASWLSRRIVWQAISDAIAYPEQTTDIANSVIQFKTTSKLFETIAKLRHGIRRQQTLTDIDANALYTLVTVLLCNGIAGPLL